MALSKIFTQAANGLLSLTPYELLRETWEDLPLLGIARPGVSSPTFAQYGSTAFWGWKMEAGNIFYADQQFRHEWDLGLVRPHIHISCDNTGFGGVTFEHRIMTKPANSGAWSTETICTKSWAGSIGLGTGVVIDLYDGDGFQPSSPGPSTLIKAVLTMTAKGFSGNIFLDGWDIHYKSDKFGTETEY